MAEETFDPRKHLIQLKGKLYLETKYRIQWFRQEHPHGAISTEVLSYDPVLVKATIFDGDGKLLATGHGGAVDKGNAVWSGRGVEKAETAAIGRALAVAGYGTQFAEDDEVESGNLADAPVERRPPVSKAARRAEMTANNGQQHGTNTDDLRDKSVATAFIARWRGQSLSDADVLAALGVSRLSEWTKGRAAADEAVNAWLAAKLQQQSA